MSTGTPSPAPAVPSARATVARGIACACFAAFVFSLTYALIKSLGGRYSFVQVMFCRTGFALLVMAPLLLRQGWGMVRTRRPWGHALRTFCGLASMACIFAVLPVLPLADATVLSYATPLFVTVLSIPLLGERVGWRRALAVLAGFGGVLMIAQPSGAWLQAGSSGWWAAPAALGSALFYAIAAITMRRLGTTESSATTTFWFTAGSTLVAAPVVPFLWTMPDAADWLRLASVGVLGGTAQLVLTSAYRFAPASVVAPFDYTALIWALVIGAALFGEVPGWTTLAGAAVLVAASLFIFWRETVARPAVATEREGRTPATSA